MQVFNTTTITAEKIRLQRQRLAYTLAAHNNLNIVNIQEMPNEPSWESVQAWANNFKSAKKTKIQLKDRIDCFVFEFMNISIF